MYGGHIVNDFDRSVPLSYSWRDARLDDVQSANSIGELPPSDVVKLPYHIQYTDLSVILPAFM